MNNIIFVTKNNNNFYKGEVGKTLQRFIEYDFTYFWEQCIELGKSSRQVGGYTTKQFHIIKNLITKCHPYFEAQINSDFEYIVLDCIIEYICHSENIGLEELWARCISPKNLYEKAIFSRVSEYKTNRAINQWANLMRMQEYAKLKLGFLFDGAPTSAEIYLGRKGYFDLTFSVAAKELGFPSGELSAVKCYNPSLLPNAAFMVSKVSKGVLRRIGDIVDNAAEPGYSHVSDCMRDQIGLDAFSYIKNLPRPQDADIDAAAEIFSKLAGEVYMPDSFKSIIDLEFDKMIEQEIHFQKCEKCGKYFFKEQNYSGRYCNRVNTSGLTCREQTGDIKSVEEIMSEALEDRCAKLYESLENKVGEAFEEHEFKEWSQYLVNMKENVQKEYSTTQDLEDFLDYSEKMCSEVKKSHKSAKARQAAPSPQAAVIKASQAFVPKAFDDDAEPPRYHFPTLEELDRQ